jgi:threonine/homoserine/homoserine lactone efflux protein
MFPIELWITYTAACVLIVLAPGPDIVLSVARGLSQGRRAALLSSAGAGLGIMCHAIAATFGLLLLLEASELAFWVVKLVGAAYLAWLGMQALRSRNLVTFEPVEQLSPGKVFLAGFLSDVLNPKIAFFVLAFIPQFTSLERGPVSVQMLVYGAWLATLAAIGLGAVGCFAAQLSNRLRQRPRAVAGVNVGAGLTFVSTGLSALALKQR